MNTLSLLLGFLTLLPQVVQNQGVQDQGVQHSGSERELTVSPPRIETVGQDASGSIQIDGVLSEQQWAQAARLTGFSQYQPVDGRPAEEPTEVLVWYAPDAIYFGIRATELHGDVVRATQANRDNIASEDHIQILLDTYNDSRIAFLFSVNPLGVQADGTRSDQSGGGAGGRSATGGGSTNINPMEGNVDLNPDFTFESMGRLVPTGYEVEIRIPFKSLRYQEGDSQTWGIHVLRRVQHSGFQDSWAPAVRANASFLGQGGKLQGLHDLKRGLVLEVTPTAVGKLDGARSESGDWTYEEGGALSGDIRWGIRENLTLTGTINPDFSQVEADVGQVVLNERFALFYPEKRTFFLEGLELFETPSQLIYTRKIVAPEAGLKLGGKLGKINAGTILAVEDKQYSASGTDNPLFAIARLRSDLSSNATLGGVLTAREDGDDYSRLLGADLRVIHSKLYFAEFQAAQAWTSVGSVQSGGPLLRAVWDRTGRKWGFNMSVTAIDPDFDAAAGFVNRTGIAQASAFHRLTAYGEKGALFETFGAFGGFSRIWDYADVSAGPIEGSESLSPSATLRGGWRVGGSFSRNFYGFKADDYEDYRVLQAPGDTVAFVVPGTERNQLSGSVNLTTPTFRYATATASVGFGNTPLFAEATPGRSRRYSASIDLRPTNALRMTLQYTHLTLDRALNGSEFSSEDIPRVKIEYQLTPSIFVRVIGQYASRSRTPLRNRNNNPMIVSGTVDNGSTSNEFRFDWLFSYRPTPGTLVYVGYGATMEEAGQQRFRELSRSVDGFFAKVSYLFRV